MEQGLDQFELAFEQEAALERRRRRSCASAPRPARAPVDIQSTEKRGNVSFGLLLVALTLTVVVVTVVMFETLAWLMAASARPAHVPSTLGCSQPPQSHAPQSPRPAAEASRSRRSKRSAKRSLGGIVSVVA